MKDKDLILNTKLTEYTRQAFYNALKQIGTIMIRRLRNVSRNESTGFPVLDDIIWRKDHLRHWWYRDCYMENLRYLQ